MKKLFKLVLVSKDAQKANSGYPCKDNKKRGTTTSQEASGQLAQQTQSRQKMDSEVESELSLPDSDSEMEKGNAGQ